MKQTIAIDIDDVLAVNVPSFIKYSNKKWGTNLSIDDYDEYWGKMWKVDDTEMRRRGDEYHGSGVFGTYDHYPEAKPVLERLAKKYKLVITTARQIVLQKETLEWIDQYFPGIFSEVHFAGMWDELTPESHLATKAELCQSIGADYLIDDQPKHCIGAADVGLQALVFGEYPWNKHLKESDKITRVRNWQDIAEYFGV